MLQVLFVLSVFSSYLSKFSFSFFEYYNNMTYGFNKNSQVSLNITNITSPFILGFATNKEKDQLTSLSNSMKTCSLQEKFTNIQFYIENDTFVENFLIQSKQVLTFYSFSCETRYSFIINLNINNVKYRYDYRLHTISVFLLAFSIIFFVAGAIFLIIYIIFREYKKKNHQYIKTFTFLYPLISGILLIVLYAELEASKNDEYLTINLVFEKVIIAIFAVLVLIQHLSLHFGESSNYIFNSFKYKKWHFITFMFGFFLSIIVALISIVAPVNIATYFVNSIFYLILIVFFSILPSIPSPNKYGVLIFLCGAFFPYCVRLQTLASSQITLSKGMILFYFDVVTLIITTICVVLSTIHYFWFDPYINVNSLKTINFNEPNNNYNLENQMYNTLFYIHNDF